MPKQMSKVPAEARGLYKQPKSDNWWLRYTDEGSGKQIRVSLGTTDYAEAVDKAKVERGKTYYDRKPKGLAWADAVEGYIAEKLAGINNCRTFRLKTAANVRLELNFFAEFAGVSAPHEVTEKQLVRYYEYYRNPGPMRATTKRKPKVYRRKFKVPRLTKKAPVPMRKGSEAGARTNLARVVAFLEHLGLLKSRPSLPKGARLERREVVVPVDKSLKLIADCPRADLKFVLICGFCMGMRRSEIIAVRPSWFVLSANDARLEIPAEEEQPLANGKKRLWRTKNGKGREIPLPPQMLQYLREHPEVLEKGRLFVLHPEACGGMYRYDPRKPFENYMAFQGMPEVCMHAMRHSFATNLAHTEGYNVGMLAAWLGDNLQTVDRNYFHGRAPKGALDAAFTKPEDRKDAEAAKVQETASAVAAEVLKQAKHLPVQPAWEWTENAPAIHVQMYSVEDTVKFLDAFQALVVPEADQSECTALQSDWEEGKLSTERARLIILERGGWIKKTDRS